MVSFWGCSRQQIHESEIPTIMKKVLSAVLVLALLASFTACSDSSQETSSVITSQTPTTKPVPTTRPQEVPVFEPVVFVDNEDLLFQINAASNDPIWGYTLKAHMENRTDQDLMFTLEAVSVNGYMCDPFFAATVTAGMKANKDISFSLDSFASIGISFALYKKKAIPASAGDNGSDE